MTRLARFAVLVLGLLAVASPALAQWSRVLAVPASNMFYVASVGDTIAAGADTCVFLSTDAGASWRVSSKPVVGVSVIDAVLMRDGRLYAGTLGQGVFFSDDLGSTWHAFNQGLVGGVLDSQLDVSDLRTRGDSLYAATLGAGVYVRNLAALDTWHHFGEEFEPEQASNVNSLALGGTRLLAQAGSNGEEFFRDRDDPVWTISQLDNVGLHPGLTAQNAAWTGTGWVVGTNLGLFRSIAGESPWTFLNPGLGPLDWTTFATSGRRLFGAFDVVNAAEIEFSLDDGASWHVLERLSGVFVFQLAMNGPNLYAARADGLWRRTTANVSVPAAAEPIRMSFALAGPQPVGDDVRLHFELGEPGSASIEVFDVAGRRAGERIERAWSAGAHDVSWSARGLAPGVYEARLTAAGRGASVRLVHVR